MSHLVVALSSHGFGHIGQTAPVVRELHRRDPSLRVTIISTAPTYKLSERFSDRVEFVSRSLDIGMIQSDAISIDLKASAEAYANLHAAWSYRVEVESRFLTSLEPSLVIANVPYLAVAAASAVGIPSVGFCSINWAEIYAHFFLQRRPEAPRLIREMLAAYNRADVFIRPEPAMPFSGIERVVPTGPVAEIPKSHREVVRRRLGLGEQQLVMVSLGGMTLGLEASEWPLRSDVHFVVPDDWDVVRPDMTPLSHVNVPYIQLLTACDAVIAKPGYGSFVEAACLGLPLLYVPRPGWPEVPFLVDWLQEHGRCAALTTEELASRLVHHRLAALWEQPPPEPVVPRGVTEVADLLMPRLSG